jgi:hypothetical protein
MGVRYLASHASLASSSMNPKPPKPSAPGGGPASSASSRGHHMQSWRDPTAAVARWTSEVYLRPRAPRVGLASSSLGRGGMPARRGPPSARSATCSLASLVSGAADRRDRTKRKDKVEDKRGESGRERKNTRIITCGPQTL